MSEPLSPTRSGPRVWLGGSLTLLALAMIGVVTYLNHRPGATAVLMDGSRLRFVGATYGTRHEVFPGTVLESWLLQHLPRSTTARWWPVRPNFATERSTLGVWLERRPTLGAMPIAATEIATIGPADGAGPASEALPTGGHRSGNLLYEAWRVPQFPRRVPTLRFQLFYERPSLPPQPLAEFRFPNPEFRSGAEAPPQWQPDPLPARPRPDPSSGGADGPPTLLETLQLRQDWQENTPFRRRYPIVQTVLELRTEPHAGALPNLEPTFLELSDATGNVWVSRILSTAPLGEGRSRIRTDLSGCLWSGEQAYRVKIEFRVPPGSPAASGMTVVETGPLAVPPPPRAASRLALEEVEVALSTIPTRRRGGTGPLPSLRVTLRSGRTGLTPVLLQATGPGDQPIRTTLLPGQGRLGSESTEVRLEAIPGPVRLKIGLYQAPVLTWVAAPAAPSQ